MEWNRETEGFILLVYRILPILILIAALTVFILMLRVFLRKEKGDKK